MNRSGVRALAAAWEQVSDPRNTVLATVVATEGSSYRKAGARMLIELQPGRDRVTGIVGGGCFDEDLIEHAREVAASRRCQVKLYDMRSDDDLLWGLGMGCNGAVKVLLQPLESDDSNPVLLASRLEHSGGGLLVTDIDSGTSRISTGSEFELKYPGLVQTGPRTLFVHPVPGFFQLGIFGTGSDVLPLVEMADQLDWVVRLWDHRSGHVQPQRFPAARCVEHFSGPAPDHAQACDALLVMSHNFAADTRFLDAISQLDVPYVGVLGPASRRDQLLRELGERGAALKSRLRGPLGLDLGGDSPEAIALSICAELQALRFARPAHPLNQTPQPG